MECHEARLLIDERVHGSLNVDVAAQLDGHLKNCADCREDLRQLEKMRELLAVAKRDMPTQKMLADIWASVAAANSAETSSGAERKPAMTSATSTQFVSRAASTQQRRTHWKLVAVSSLVAAAVIFVAFVLGQAQNSSPPQRIAMQQYQSVDGSAPTNLRRTELSVESGIDVPPDVSKRAELGDHFETINPERKPKISGNKDTWSAGSSSSGGSSSGGGGDMDGEAYSQPTAPVSTPPAESRPADAPVALPISGELSNLKNDRAFDPKGKEFDKKHAGSENTGGVKNSSVAADTSKQKIIKTGELTVEVKNFVEASRAVDALVIKFNGLLADSRTYDLPGATKRGEIVVRVAPDKFEEVFAELKKLGVVLNERAGGQDITAQYTDTEARIKNLQIAEARLQELIKEKSFMDKISSLLEVERELSRVRGEIESMQGTMRVWTDQISLSTIHLTLTEPTRPVPSGSLSVEVATLSEAKKTLDAALTNTTSNLLSGQITKRPDGTLMGTYTLRVKFGRFGELMAAIKGLGRVQDEHVQNQPLAGGIPDGAQDVPADLSLILFERPIQLPNGSLTLEVQSLGDAMKQLDIELGTAQATIISNQTQRQSDGSTTANISLRVRAGNFASLAEALPQLGRITHRTVSGEAGKVQGGAADVPVTLNLYLYEQHKQVPTGHMAIEVDSFTSARDRLSTLIKDNHLQVLGSDSQQRQDGSWAGSFKLGIKAEKMDSIVGEIEKFGRVKTRQLQGLGLGDLSKVDPNVVGEVAVIIEERPALAPQEEGSFRLMLRDTFGGFLTSMSYIIRGLGMIFPWAALAALLLALIWKITKRSEATAPASPVASKNKVPPSEPPKEQGPGAKGQGPGTT